MSTDANLELHQFYHFVGEKLSIGELPISPEEALDQWRLTHRRPEDLDEDVAAVREALEDMAKGDHGVPLEDFDREFRNRHGLTAES